MATTALSVGDLMRGDARLVVAIGYGQAQECVCSKDGLVSQIPDHNLKAHEAVLICRARRRIGTDWREHEQLPPNGSFILSLKGLDRGSRSMGIENFHAQALYPPRSGASLGGGRLMGCGSELPGPPRCPWPCVCLCCNPSESRVSQGLSGSFRVFQGLPGVQRGSPSVAAFCYASALAGVPHFRASAECGRILTRYRYTKHPPSTHTSRLFHPPDTVGHVHVLVYPHHSLSPALVHRNSSKWQGHTNGATFEVARALPQNWRVSHVIALGDVRVWNPKMRPRPLNWLRFPSSAVGKS
jgi:hypothetical protein